MKRVTWRLVAAGIGAVATIGMITVPAGLATASPVQHIGVGLRGPAAAVPQLNIPRDKDNSFAGYSASPGKGVTSLTARFAVPSVSCPAHSEVNIAGGIYDTKGFLQAGADVIVECTDGVPAYGISALTYNTHSPTVAVKPGDLITVSDTETASATTATAKDTTAHTSATAEDATDSSGNPSASFIVGLFDDTGNIPTFGSISMSGVTANGRGLAQVHPTRFQLTDGVHFLIRTTVLSGSKFSLTFRHNT